MVYKIICYGRHSDLLNLSFNLSKEISSIRKIDVQIYTDRNQIDGQTDNELEFQNKSSLKVACELVFKRNQIIHIVSPSFKSFLIGLLAKILCHTVFYNIHRFDFASYRTLKRVFLILFTISAFCISNKVFIHIKKKKFLFWKKKLCFVELPLHSHFKPITSITGDEILLFGRLDTNKGLEFFYELAKILPEERFRLCGEVVDKNLNLIINKIKKCKNVETQLNRVDTEEIPSIFSKAKFIILPYTDASQSGVIYLAKSLGMPVLISDVGDLKNSLKTKHEGICLEKGNIQLWKDTIQKTNWVELKKELLNTLNEDYTCGYNLHLENFFNQIND